MAHEMFGDVVRPSIRVGTKKWYTLPLSVLTHSVGLCALIVVPLLATGTLPDPRTTLIFGDVLPATSVPPPDLLPANARPLPEIDVTVNVNAAPVEAPDGVNPEPPPRLAPIVVGMPSSPALLGNASVFAPKPTSSGPVRVGGDVRRPEKIRHVDPLYPAIAKAARVSGMVIVEAVIATDGSVRGARVTRSVPMLNQAALDAVNQWRYTPTMLNGQAVEVIMSVNVTFDIK